MGHDFDLQLVTQKDIPFVFDGTASTLSFFKESTKSFMRQGYQIAEENNFILDKLLDSDDILELLNDGKAVIAGEKLYICFLKRKYKTSDAGSQYCCSPPPP